MAISVLTYLSAHNFLVCSAIFDENTVSDEPTAILVGTTGSSISLGIDTNDGWPANTASTRGASANPFCPASNAYRPPQQNPATPIFTPGFSVRKISRNDFTIGIVTD